MKKFQLIVIVLLSILLISCKNQKSSKETPVQYTQRIPAGENSWISHNEQHDYQIITKEGIRNWNGSEPLKTYFRISEQGELSVGLHLKTSSEKVILKATLNGVSKKIPLKNDIFGDVYLGEYPITQSGYQELILEILQPDPDVSVDINEVLLAGKAAEGDVNFVTDNFHFGRRGPSVHLRYLIPEESDKPLYFYNEIEVPEGEDVIGSYYMANGFSHGYFGIQVNSESERRILFSVWSPYDTQDPDEIPEDQKIVLLKKGDGVNTGEFGNEGSGGQSFKRYMWKTGTTYRFLLKGEPAGPDHTVYTAYFYTPEKDEWELIARFKRHKASNYLGNLYSFLENFVPATGDTARKAHYKNQWIYDKDKGWIELTKAIFTADATANQKDRMDYAGGEIDEGYYLKNCGFFNNFTQVETEFSRKENGSAPQIKFKNLP
ncbi:DUF3472 domain-containing protein [Salinimicrobium tongyeongense]|uniref:DUF3472 domain-containing protein n=1 Tax=Salinimicrobium tongyeongense TaxID=2809707 RepID=A0ABY6NRG3_9FLAO|nr:DUF3472 domain-containing protein [Salinimicrobium tongyeongense]UZH55418.1 DUF3472 domain-containing protein [Salinimicrobium tongyeongense]